MKFLLYLILRGCLNYIKLYFNIVYQPQFHNGKAVSHSDAIYDGKPQRGFIEPKKFINYDKLFLLWSPPDRWLSHIHLAFPSLQFDLVWADEDFPSSGHIYLENNLIKSIEYQYDDLKALEFVKTHFPEFYNRRIVQHELFKIAKKVSPELTIYFKSIRRTIKNLKFVFSHCEVYMCSPNSFRVSVWRKRTKISKTNIFSDLPSQIQKSILEKALELLENEGIRCKIKKNVLEIKN